jgi:transposase InsO family protein
LLQPPLRAEIDAMPKQDASPRARIPQPRTESGVDARVPAPLAAGTGTVFIDPGSPWQNAWIESFNGRMRDEHLNGQQFDSLLEAQVFTEDWRIDYNINRPHSAHGWLTPVEFVEEWLHQQAHQLA